MSALVAAAAPVSTPAAPADAVAAAPAAPAPVEPQPGDTKAEGTPAEVKPAVDAKPAEVVPPAPLELKMPEGFNIDEATLAEFKKEAAELGLDSAKAQRLVEFQAKSAAAADKAAVEAFTKRDAEWQATLKADPEFGGDKLPATEADAQKALLKWGGADAVELVRLTGLGNHPVLVKLFARIGRSTADDSMALSTAGSSAQSDDAEASYRALYPNSPGMFPSH